MPGPDKPNDNKSSTPTVDEDGFGEDHQSKPDDSDQKEDQIDDGDQKNTGMSGKP